MSQVNYVKYAGVAVPVRDLQKGRTQRFRCMACRGSMGVGEATELRPGFWGHKKHRKDFK